MAPKAQQSSKTMDTGETATIDQRVRDLERFCASDALSLKKLPAKTMHVPPDSVAESDFLLFACENKRVTRGIVAHLLRKYPRAASKRRDDGEHPGSYPLHRAAANPCCPGSAIKLLLDIRPQVASLHADLGGTPLHWYLGREGFEPEYDVVKCLVEAHPEALTTNISVMGGITPLHLFCDGGVGVSLDIVQLLVDKKRECLSMTGYSTPLISLVRNTNIPFFPVEVVRYFIENMPHSIVTENHPFNGNVLHVACLNEHVTAEALQLLLSVEGDMVRKTDLRGSLPLHIFCYHSTLDDATSLEILNLLVEKYPESVRAPENRRDELPIHHACAHQSFEFCKYLVEKYPESVSVKKKGRSLFHLACAHGSIDLVRYLFELRPESMQEQTSDDDYEYDDKGQYMDELDLEEPLQQGYFPLHLAASSLHADRKDVVQFILEKDKKAASRVGKWGRLPLHQACSGNLNLGVVETIFKAYPKAIHTEDMVGRIPIHFAMGCDELRKNRDWEKVVPASSSKRQTSRVLSYLFNQLPYSLEAKDQAGRVCAHYACSTSHAQLKIKFIEENCTDAFKIPSIKHGLPIHVACTEGAPVDVIGRLMIMLPGSLNINHSNIGLPLDCAQDPKTFNLLLSVRYYSSMERGATALCSVLLDEEIGAYHKVGLIEKFVDFDQSEQTEEFQGDFSKMDKQGRYRLHLIFDAFNKVVTNGMPEDLLSHLHKRYAKLTLGLIRCNQEAISTKDSRGWLPLHYAIEHKAPLKVIDVLLTKYPEGVTTKDKHGSLPLHLSCRYGSSLELIDVLLTKYPEGATIKDKHGSLPLHTSCRYGSSLDVINALVKTAGDGVVVSLDNNGCSPVHVASRHQLSPDSICRLIDLDESVLMLPDNQGELPMHKACRAGNLLLIQELMSKSAPSASVRNALNELPVFILCKKARKDKGMLESFLYVEMIWKLLLVHPETVAI